MKQIYHGHDISPCTLQSKYTNMGYRICHFINMITGNNLYSNFKFYSDHVETLLDQEEIKQDNRIAIDNETGEEITDPSKIIRSKRDTRVLRGAIGPRIRNWVGSHQLKEANEINCTVKDDEDFVKPNGVNQIMCALADLKDDDMKATTIIIRDPAIDFDASNDIPELISISFSKTKNVHEEISTVMVFESNNNIIVNDIWAMQVLTCIFVEMLKQFRSFNLDAYCISSEEEPCYNHNTSFRSMPRRRFPEVSEEQLYFDMINLAHVEKFVVNSFKEESFYNDEISINYLIQKLESTLIDKIHHKLLKDMCYALVIFAIKKAKSEAHDANIEILRQKVETSFYKTEIELFLLDYGK